MKRALIVLCSIAVAGPALAAPPAVPATPAAVREVLYARPFLLDEGFQFDWRAERPLVKSGYLVVLEVEPELVYPRAAPEPVLYVDRQTAWRLNIGYRSGRVVALVPGELDLAAAPIWFGAPAAPEQVDGAEIGRERAAAVAAGIGPLAVAEAIRRGGPALSRPAVADLLSDAAELVRRYAPDEAEQARILAGQSR